MGTNQALTTKQVTVLTMLNDFECYMDFEEIIKDFSWDEIGVKLDEEEEIFDILEHYGYIGSDRMLTLDGKQYLYLLEEYVDKATKGSAVELNGSFSLINIEILGRNFDYIAAFSKVFKVANDLSGVIKTILLK